MSGKKRGQAVCLGYFDGVHRGHLALLAAAREIGEKEGLRVCAHTFSAPPGSKGESLTSLRERIRLLKAAGAQEVAVSPFDEATRRMSGEEFFEAVLIRRLNARHLICGDDHRFGYRGAWGVKELSQMCRQHQIGLTVVPPVTLPDGVRISTTALRAALEANDWPRAEEMLGRKVTEEMKKRFQKKDV